MDKPYHEVRKAGRPAPASAREHTAAGRESPGPLMPALPIQQHGCLWRARAHCSKPRGHRFLANVMKEVLLSEQLMGGRDCREKKWFLRRI